MNQEGNITLDELPSVSQDEIFDIIDQPASSFSLGPYVD